MAANTSKRMQYGSYPHRYTDIIVNLDYASRTGIENVVHFVTGYWLCYPPLQWLRG
jgi:hypothetical protein